MLKLLSTTFLSTFLLTSVIVACSSDDEPGEEKKEGSSGGGQGGVAGDGDGDTGTGDGDGDGDTGDGDTAGTGGSVELAPPDCDPAPDLGVRIVGRHDGCVDGVVQMAWSGTGFVARFEGTGLTFTQSGAAVEYTIVVDGEVQEKVVTESTEGTYTAATGLESGEHVVEVYRRSEASFGTVALSAVEVEGGSLLDPPARPERRIEVFGDSITCGYGNEGADTSCSFSADTENHYMTYAAIMARDFDAELSTVAWSGKGVVINYGGDMGTTLTEMVERAVPRTASSVWDFSAVPPADLVMINLGTNDFSTDNDPTPEDFTAGYVELLSTIRARYPDALILCTLGPLLTGTDLATAEGAILAAIAELEAGGDAGLLYHDMVTGNPSPGCDWHPSIATHEAMAAELGTVVSAELGW